MQTLTARAVSKLKCTQTGKHTLDLEDSLDIGLKKKKKYLSPEVPEIKPKACALQASFVLVGCSLCLNADLIFQCVGVSI